MSNEKQVLYTDTIVDMDIVVRNNNFSGITGAGLEKHENQDSMFLSSVDTLPVYAVLCDGISSLPHAAVASSCATEAASNCLNKTRVTVEACEKAAVAVDLLADKFSGQETPGTTFLAVRVSRGKLPRSFEVEWSWVGDTVLCWVPNTGSPVILSEGHTDSSGALTKSLGRGADNSPDFSKAVFPSGGHLVLCTDGLWKYDKNFVISSALIRNSLTSEEACKSLFSYAHSCGAIDNVSIVVINLM